MSLQERAKELCGRQRPRVRRSVVIAAAGGLVLMGSGAISARPPRQPVLASVEVGEVVLRPVELSGADAASWVGLDEQLVRQAETALRHWVVDERLASALATTAGAPRLTGSLEMPAALPAGVRGSWAAFRKGMLATARLQLVDGNGTTLATATSSIEWDDVRWTTGGPKLKRQRPPAAALTDAADRVMRLATRELTGALLASGPHAVSESPPSWWHRHVMAGRILESSSRGVYLCIGSAERAAAGQRLAVTRSVRDHGGGPKQSVRFERRNVAVVRITEVVDGHFAWATVISGRPRKRDVVRLAAPSAQTDDASAAAMAPASKEVTR